MAKSFRLGQSVIALCTEIKLTPEGLASATPRRGAASMPAGVMALPNGRAANAAAAIACLIDFIMPSDLVAEYN